MAFHVMIIPSMNCPSDCSYCWGVDRDSKVMDIETIRDTVEWLRGFRDEPATFTFHGGEPLLAGYDFYREALRLISEELSFLRPLLSPQQRNRLHMDTPLSCHPYGRVEFFLQPQGSFLPCRDHSMHALSTSCN